MSWCLLFPSRENELGWYIWKLWHCSFSPVLKLGTYSCGNFACWGSEKRLKWRVEGGDRMSCPPLPRGHHQRILFWKCFSLQGSWNRILIFLKRKRRFPCLCYCLALLLTLEFSSKTLYFDLGYHGFFSLRSVGAVEDRMSSLTRVSTSFY